MVVDSSNYAAWRIDRDTHTGRTLLTERESVLEKEIAMSDRDSWGHDHDWGGWDNKDDWGGWHHRHHWGGWDDKNHWGGWDHKNRWGGWD